MDDMVKRTRTLLVTLIDDFSDIVYNDCRVGASRILFLLAQLCRGLYVWNDILMVNL